MRTPRVIVFATLTTLALAAAPALAADNFLFTFLSGFDEVPALLSPGTGSFRAFVRNETSIDYELQYENLTSTALQAHIHFGQKDVNGGVVVFLCGGGAAPACGPNGASGTLTASDVTAAAAAQGIAAGDFAGLLAAIRSGNAYANVHTSVFPNGEIRGQLR
jgi:hypothetical protein